MKNSKDFIKEVLFPNTSQEDFELWCNTNELFNSITVMIQLAQEDAIEETVRRCVEGAECTSVDMDGFYSVDKESILSVANKLIKEL